MRCSFLIMPLVGALSFALSVGVSLANPNRAPDAKPAIIEEIDLPASMILDMALSNEDLMRDGLTASYYATFSLSVAVLEPTYIKVAEGDGYVVIEPVLTREDTISVFGNVLGAYEDGMWKTQVNVIERIDQGGTPYSRFRSPDRIILIAGKADLESFVSKRSETAALIHQLAMQDKALMHQLAVQQIEADAVEVQRRTELEAEAQAAASEAERTLVRTTEATRIAEREAMDQIILALFTEGANLPGQVVSNGVRLSGEFNVTRVTESLVEGIAVFDKGNGDSYTMPFILRLSGAVGDLNILNPSPHEFNEETSTICETVGSLNIIGGFVVFESRAYMCRFEIVIDGLGGSND